MTGSVDKEAGRIRAALNARRTRYSQSDVIDSYYEYVSPEDAILRELRESDLRVVLDRLRQLEGEQLNPAAETLDADAYRYLRDEIAVTMTDDWDGDEAESWILARYVRWLAAGQPRDEDGYPVRRESYPPADKPSAVFGATDDGRLRIVCPACDWDAVYPSLDLLTAAAIVREHVATHVPLCECGCVPGQPCICTLNDCDCIGDCPICDAEEADHA